jgi:ATP-binding cassette subfamily C protein CydCD
MAALGSAALGAGRVTGPGLALLILLPVALAEVAGGVVEAGSLVGRVQAAEARLQAYRTLTPAVSDPAVPARDPRTTEVVAGDLTLGWDGTAVLSDLDLTLAPGEHVAVVGPSGCGKSTLAASLIRFIDPLGGEVRFGEVPLPDLALDSVRRQIGYVDDDPHVFATSLAENVRLARPDASDDDVLEALRAARLGDWVASLPDGLHSWLGDGHGQVSGGERARLGLARSLLLDQSVLVLDEPVAHLDRATAQRLTDDLLDAAGDQTVVWITHSDLGLGRMDRVIDLG